MESHCFVNNSNFPLLKGNSWKVGEKVVKIIWKTKRIG